jgi:putative membrane protein
MRTSLKRHARYAMMGAAWVGALAAAACKPRVPNAESGRVNAPATTDSAMNKMATGDTLNTSANKSTLTDPNIVALLDEANKADSAAGAFAFGKATSPDVKSFAKLMMGEHHTLRVKGEALAKKLNVTPQPPADDPVKTAGESEMTALRSAKKGAMFDSTYIHQEVTIHKAVLELAGKAHDDTKTDELKKLIESAKPIIQKHLDRAEDLQKKLGKATT